MDPGTRYINSFYFTTASNMAVGYGDIYAHTTQERLVAMLIQLSGAAMFGFLMAAITNFLETHNPRAGEIKKKQEEVMEWSYGRELPKQLRKNVREHIHYFYMKKSLFDNSEYLTDCPIEYRQALLQTINYDKIQAFILFRVMSTKLVCTLVTQMLPMSLARNERVIEDGTVIRDIYFVAAGRIHATKDEPSRTDEEPLVFGVYQTGDHFAETLVLLHIEAEFDYEARARTNELLLIPGQTFRDALQDVPEEQEVLVAAAEDHRRNLQECLASAPNAASGDFHAPKIVCGNALNIDRKEFYYRIIDTKKSGSIADGVLISKDTAEEKAKLLRKTVKTRTEPGSVAGKIVRCIDEQTLILPDRSWKLAWDVFLGVLIVYSVFVIPLRIGFGVEPVGLAEIFDITVDVLFGVDMIFTSRTAVQDGPDMLIKDARTIMRRYLKSWFVVDLASTFPTDRVVQWLCKITTGTRRTQSRKHGR